MTPTLHVLCSIGLPAGGQVDVVRRRYGNGEGPRVAVVAGLRGDCPEGVRVAHLLSQALEQLETIRGQVDIYPCVNPLAALRGSRNWPFFDQDLNRRFPGRPDRHAPDVVAHALVEDVRGADQVFELRGPPASFREAPQAHVRSQSPESAALAQRGNVDAVWVREPTLAAASTFGGQFPNTITLQGGTGNRLTGGVGQVLAEGVLNMLNVLKVVADEDLPFHWAGMTRPLVVQDADVHRLRASRAGLFLPSVSVWAELAPGAELGCVIEPTSGTVLERLTSPLAGRVLAIRDQPVVLPGTMVARVVRSG